MKHRLEDLGRIREKLGRMLEMEIFDIVPMRAEDFQEDFQEMDIDKQYILLNKLAYGIKEIEEVISDCYLIASGNEDD